MSAAAFAARLLPNGIKRRLYQVKPLASRLRESLNRAVPEGLGQVQVAAGALAGLDLCLDLQTEKDYWLGTYEMELQQAIADWVQPGWVVYDVGANIGYISLVFARRVAATGQVHSFEALPANVERLKVNIALNDHLAAFYPLHTAVVERSREVEFLVGPSHGMGKAVGSAGRDDIEYSETLRVPGMCLDDYVFSLGNTPPQAVKMDIEGGEVLALKGMLKLLAQFSPVFFLELHGETAARQSWEMLVSAGYRILKMQAAGSYPPVACVNDLDWKAYLVAVKD